MKRCLGRAVCRFAWDFGGLGAHWRTFVHGLQGFVHGLKGFVHGLGSFAHGLDGFVLHGVERPGIDERDG